MRLIGGHVLVRMTNSAPRSLGVEDEPAGAHQWPAVYVDVAVGRDGVDVDAGAPGCAGLVGVGVAEGDVYAGILLVLEQIADQPGQRGVGTYGELSHPPAIFRAVEVAG